LSLETSIECVLFDLDGTLIDTAPDFIQVVNQLLEEYGKPSIDSRLIYKNVSDGARALVKLAFGINESENIFQQLNQQLLDLYAEKIKATESSLYPSIDNLLIQLESASIPWGIVTNKPNLYASALLEQLNLYQRCSALICPDHVQNRKPHPEPIFLACQKLGCNTERTIYIGDHLRDIQAAKSADVIAVAAAYGYLNEGNKIEEWHADFIVQKPEQIEPLLNSLKFT
jgi:phosphoglycolate phosphatase